MLEKVVLSLFSNESKTERKFKKLDHRESNISLRQTIRNYLCLRVARLNNTPAFEEDDIDELGTRKKK